MTKAILVKFRFFPGSMKKKIILSILKSEMPFKMKKKNQKKNVSLPYLKIFRQVMRNTFIFFIWPNIFLIGVGQKLLNVADFQFDID